MSNLPNFWRGVPSHWEVRRNRFIFYERNERDAENLPLAAVSQKHGVIEKRELEAIEARKLSTENDDLSKYKLIEPGDIVYNKMRMWQGAVGVSSLSAIVSPAYIVAAPQHGVDSRFMAYLLKSEPYVVQSGLYSYGICDDQNSLRWEDFANLLSPLPPHTDQTRIANFLDEKTARIDALIAEKESLDSSLGELLLAELKNLMTRGLADNVELAPSGEPFIGFVPSHWRVIAWKRMGAFTGGAGFPIDFQGKTDGEIPFFKVKDLHADDLLTPLMATDSSISRETAKKLRANIFEPGTLVFAKVGAALLLQRVRVLGVPSCLDVASRVIMYPFEAGRCTEQGT